MEHQKDLQERYERLKKDFDDFVYIVSHDFRAGFRKVNSMCDWINEDMKEDNQEEVLNSLELLKKTSFEMNQMLDGLILLSRIDKTTDDINHHDLNLLLTEIKTENSALSELQINIVGKLPTIRLPQKLAIDLFSELLKNAVTFNHSAKKEVTISTTEETDKISITIADNGFGFFVKDLTKPFKLFFTEKTKTKVESPGYGLTYAKKIIESIDGTLSIVKSSKEGTTVKLTYPK